jgi:hypothetical protein
MTLSGNGSSTTPEPLPSLSEAIGMLESGIGVFFEEIFGDEVIKDDKGKCFFGFIDQEINKKPATVKARIAAAIITDIKL